MFDANPVISFFFFFFFRVDDNSNKDNLTVIITLMTDFTATHVSATGGGCNRQ